MSVTGLVIVVVLLAASIGVYLKGLYARGYVYFFYFGFEVLDQD